MPTIRKPFQILLLCFIVLSVYYVAMFSEICLLDDRDVVVSLSNTEQINLKAIFFPHSAKGEYYRPLIGVFYMLDRFVYDLDPRVMHFENILFHLLNVLLVFLIASQLHKTNTTHSRYIPFFTALLFALHPMATESVNWISGRTDLLAGIGVLFATFILIKHRENRSWWYWPAIVLSVLFGMLAKETAVAFFLAIFFIIKMFAIESDTVGGDSKPLQWRSITIATAAFYIAAALVALYTYSYFSVLLIMIVYAFFMHTKFNEVLQHRSLKVWGGLVISLLISVGLFFLIRKTVFTSDVASIPRTLMLITSDPIYAFKVFTGALGFYVKEFLIPFPLNLAIREIDPLYELLGILILLLTILSLQLGGRVSSLIITGLCMIAPALPLSLGTVTWTAFAERYIYLAIPFWLLAASISWSSCIDGKKTAQAIAVTSIVLLVIVFGRTTFNRNITWQTNLALFEDTVKKSPSFKITRGLYMLTLYENEKYDEALEQYRIASTLQSFVYDEKFDILYALIQMKKGKPVEAKKILTTVLQKKETTNVLESLIILLNTTRAHHAKNDPVHQQSNQLIIQYYEKLYSKTGDAIYLYRLGQDLMNNGNKTEAKKFFSKAANELPEVSEFKVYARNLATKL